MPLVLSDGQVRVLALLFPQLSDLELEQVEDTGAGVRILARTRTRHGGVPWMREAFSAAARPVPASPA